MDPEGDCDTSSLFCSFFVIGRLLWKSSMDPEGDCDFFAAWVMV